MGWQPDGEAVAGDEPRPSTGLTGSTSSTAAHPALLSEFAHGGPLDGHPPSAALATALEEGLAEAGSSVASRDELVGLLRGWAALEAWAAAGRLEVLRALIRDGSREMAGDVDPGAGEPPRVSRAGEHPGGWSKSLSCEVAAALAVSVPTADSMLWLARDLHERLPGTLGLLAAGELTYPKARAVDEALQLLGEAASARAEAMILAELPGKNYGQVKRLAEQAAVTVDPDSAARRRDDAEREKARVQLFREDSGATGLSGRDLPTAQALAAHARVCARAQQYKDCGAFPGTRIDQLRAAAYLDLLNDVTAEERIASGVLPASGTVRPTGPRDAPEPDTGSSEGPPVVAPQPSQPSPGSATPGLTDLVVPLATLLGLAERPGEGHGLGPLDPGLCRSLAILAVGSPHTSVCVTVTDPDGITVGHGCARPTRRGKSAPTGPGQPGAALPGRLNHKLRHLVQVRDGDCTFPPCTRHARDSDFEHAVPYDQGGRTCACNAGARSRQCHRVKQSPGWDVTQPRPGWHQWRTPAGRVYTQGPKRYPR
jgi:Domain of unknown function (DUF222)